MRSDIPRALLVSWSVALSLVAAATGVIPTPADAPPDEPAAAARVVDEEVSDDGPFVLATPSSTTVPVPQEPGVTTSTTLDPITTTTSTTTSTPTTTSTSTTPPATMAVADTATITKTSTTSIHVTVNDDFGGSEPVPSTLEIVGSTHHGDVSVSGLNLRYIPYEGKTTGIESFGYTICNVAGECDTASVTLTLDIS
ncbi:MAG: hypothetical protein P8J50_11480 [Acidimicrobiales bacterium]|nr:hypothetical protein [Acidimicrobiales bacterium]